MPRALNFRMTDDEFLEEVRALERYGRQLAAGTGRYDILADIDSLVGWVAVRERRRFRPGCGVRFRTFARRSVSTGFKRLLERSSRQLELAPPQWQPPPPGAALTARQQLACLSREDLELLRLRFLEGEGLEELAARYGVHRSGISRRLALLRAVVTSAHGGSREQRGPT